MRQSWIPCLLATLLASTAAHAADAPAAATPETPLRALLRGEPALAGSKRPCYSPDMLDQFYAQRGYTPAWADAAHARQALAMLADAHKHGLRSADYPLASAALDPGEPGSAAGVGADVQLSAAVLRYMADLHCGRVSTTWSAPYLAAKRAALDAPQRLATALAQGGVASLAQTVQPELAQYGYTMAALARYRQRDGEADVTLTPLQKKGSIRPADAYAGAPALHRRLVQLGDLPPTTAAGTAGKYTQALSEGVRAFQLRHGLEADGFLGRGTMQALSVPLKQRTVQLGLALERLRWLPRFAAGRVLVVNIPAYQLQAFDTAVPGQAPQLQMRVIVGQAVKSETPMLVDTMRHLELNPYWNVPRSIERDEILQKLAADPDYLLKNEMELVPRAGTTPITVVDAAAIEGLRAGTYRVRQRPGSANALGAVKFVMPNPLSIYLHSTPTRNLFAKARRDFSHGCIRVEQPEALAQFVLNGKEGWDQTAIEDAIAAGKNQWVKLPAIVQVLLDYTTARANADGGVVFYDDIYKLDDALAKSLGGV